MFLFRCGFLVLLFLLPTQAIKAESYSEEEIVVSGCRDPGSIEAIEGKGISLLEKAQQIDDTVIALRGDSVYRLALNSHANAPVSLESKIQIPNNLDTNSASYLGLLATDDLIIVLGESERGEKEYLDIIVFSNDDEITPINRYSFDSDRYETHTIYQSLSIINNQLTIVLGENFFEDLKEHEISEVRVEASDMKSENPVVLNIAESMKWVNDPSVLNESKWSTQFLQCPLDRVTLGELKCDVTAFLGVPYYSFSLNQEAGYLWSGSAFYNDSVIALSPEEVQLKPEEQLKKELSYELDTIYQLDFETGAVGAVQVDSQNFTERSYKVIDGVFSAVVRKNSPDNLHMQGLSFSIDQFSSTPVLVSDGYYQPLVEDSCDIYVNRFFGDYLFLNIFTELKSSDDQFETLVWDMSGGNKLRHYPTGDYAMDYVQREDTVIGIGSSGENNKSLMAVWSLKPDIKFLSIQKFDDLTIDVYDIVRKEGLKTPSGKPVWGAVYYRLDENGKEIEYPSYASKAEPIVDMFFFSTELNGDIKEVGQVKSEPLILKRSQQEKCRFGCSDYPLLETFFVSGDFMFVFINDQVIKSKITDQGVEILNRFHLISP